MYNYIFYNCYIIIYNILSMINYIYRFDYYKKVIKYETLHISGP